MRKKMNYGKSRRLFRATANRTRKINAQPKMYRGGIRL